MRKVILSVLCLFLLVAPLFAQVPVTGAELEKLMAVRGPGEEIRVLLVFQEQVDMLKLKEQMDAEEIPVQKRSVWVKRNCRQLAEQSQSALLNAMDQAGYDYQLVHSHWIANLVVLDAPVSTLRFLQGESSLALLDLDAAWHTRPLPVPEAQVAPSLRAPGSIEPGLAAINAPALWALGYSGKNRISFNLDTGVWPQHPAVKERFLANFFPLSQAWYAYDFPDPADKSGSHGTHTLGTALGLDPATQDTIGAAFGAYWIASDPVATSLATVKPLSDFMYAFEWSLDPDGDSTTTWDVPDVINNSWGYESPGDTALCSNSFITQVFGAVEAAGIANVFSAGNDGPGTASISEPHHVSTGLVNTFTVGAVNGNDPNYPIAGFSSRGPTNCPASGSLQIKPEVSAPGMNVRSAVGKSGYANYQGTSMAAPHVTGAVLLLKEAFPYLTGEQVLLALYYSAIDLGSPGEDNEYGMGMIDVMAAYTYLIGQNHVPVPPVAPGFDLAIKEILHPTTTFLCDSSITPQVIIENRGDSLFQAATLYFGLDSLPLQSLPWIGSLLPGQMDTLMLPSLSVNSAGKHELFVQILPDSAITESDEFNNRRYYRFTRSYSNSLPFTEAFEAPLFPEPYWSIRNEDALQGWEVAPTSGLPTGATSAVMPCAGYIPRIMQKDDLLSPGIRVPNGGGAYLRFDVAYQYRGSIFRDSLNVYVSTDCRASWSHRVYQEGGASLSTYGVVTQNFVPGDSSQWRQEEVDLSAFVGMGEIHLKFEGVNNAGNNLYIDNINLSTTPITRLSPERGMGKLWVFPSPANGRIQIDWEGTDLNGGTLRIFDLLGQEIWVEHGIEPGMEIDLSGRAKGLYHLKAEFGEKQYLGKVLLQ